MSKEPQKCCKTCKWLRVNLNKAGRRVVLADRVYPCDWPTPEIAVADSVSRSHLWRDTMAPAFRRYMEGAGGTTCPVWEPRS